MKIECTKENIYRAVSLAEQATGKKLPLLILGRIILEAKDKSFFARATNLDFGIEVKIPAKIISEGKVAVPGSLLEPHLANLRPQTSVVLETAGNNLSVTTPFSTALITCDKPDDFPELPRITGKKGSINSFVADCATLEGGLRSVLYAAALGEMKPELASINLRVENQEIILVATDSFRLAEKRISGERFLVEGEHVGSIIPLKNVSVAARALSEEKGKVTVSFNKDQISFRTDNLYAVSRLVEGNFPAYAHLFPKSFATQATVLKEELQGALRLANVFTDRFHQVNVKIIPDEGIFELHTRNQGTGESTVKVDAALEGESVDVSMNGRYLIDCFVSTNKDSVTLGFNGRDKAILLRGVGDRTFNYLVMPLHQ